MDVHETPLTAGGGREHVMDRSCWCNPEVLSQFASDDKIIIHNTIVWEEDDDSLRSV